MRPPLALTREQASRLLVYLQDYRRLALTHLAPSQERNTNQRLLQALQGKLIQEMDQPSTMHYLSVTGEEVNALRTMVRDLLQWTTREPESDRRNAKLVDLAGLKSTIEKLAIYGPGNFSAPTLL
jgi:hypothetical protein